MVSDSAKQHKLPHNKQSQNAYFANSSWHILQIMNENKLSQIRV